MVEYDDWAYYEVQLNNKQLVFFFMAALAIAVVVFLCGFIFGRAVPAGAPPPPPPGERRGTEGPAPMAPGEPREHREPDSSTDSPRCSFGAASFGPRDRAAAAPARTETGFDPGRRQRAVHHSGRRPQDGGRGAVPALAPQG